MNTPRPVSQIASDIRRVWGAKVNYAAKPYLYALLCLGAPSESYGQDSGKSIALYFLGNARSFQGEQAKALKAELKLAYGIK
jgi:hypothetical protein